MTKTDATDNLNLSKFYGKRSHAEIDQTETSVRITVLTPPKEDDSVWSPQASTRIRTLATSSIDTKDLAPLFNPSLELKIWGVALRGLWLQSPPTNYPEYTKPGEYDYVYRDLEFWTSGFFPGSLHLLLERRRRYGHLLSDASMAPPRFHDLQLEFACKYWTESLHRNANLPDTHDLGFMIMPWARVAYELNHDLRALETIKTAAHSLLSRYSDDVGCVRSWDRCITKKYNFYDKDSDFMVIIDNMMNLDLLFYTASKTEDARMFAAAVSHARMTARTHIRSDGSTIHLVVLDAKTGTIKQKLTNQGFSHTSCWARGQAWAIAGFAETYTWTRDAGFLQIACRCADYFLSRLPESGIVPWDFDAPMVGTSSQPSDVSAAMIAAYGLLILHQTLLAQGEETIYLQRAILLIRSASAHHMNPPASPVISEQNVEMVDSRGVVESRLDVDIGEGDTILKGATINNYEFAPRRWADHGLVYADYYFLLVGNKLLDLGIGPFAVDR